MTYENSLFLPRKCLLKVDIHSSYLPIQGKSIACLTLIRIKNMKNKNENRDLINHVPGYTECIRHWETVTF